MGLDVDTGTLAVSGPIGVTILGSTPSVEYGVVFGLDIPGYGVGADDRITIARYQPPERACVDAMNPEPARARVRENTGSFSATGQLMEPFATLTFEPLLLDTSRSWVRNLFTVCWCSGRSGCSKYVSIGRFQVAKAVVTGISALDGSDLLPWAGEQFDLIVEGEDLSTFDRIRVVQSVTDLICGEPGSGTNAASVIMDPTFPGEELELPRGKALRWVARVLKTDLYAVCYCRLQGVMCDSFTDFPRRAGTFRVRGPQGFNLFDVLPEYNIPFSLALIGDSPLDAQVALAADCTAPESQRASEVADIVDGAGTLTPHMGGTLQVCWRFAPEGAFVAIGPVVVIGPASLSATDGGPLRPNAGQAFDIMIGGVGLEETDRLFMVPAAENVEETNCSLPPRLVPDQVDLINGSLVWRNAFLPGSEPWIV